MKKILIGAIITILLIFSMFLILPQINAEEEGSDIQLIKDLYKNIWYAIYDLQDQINNIELLPGPQGPQGEQGLPGINGSQGPQGESGPAGPTKNLSAMVVEADGNWAAACCSQGYVRTGCSHVKSSEGAKPEGELCCRGQGIGKVYAFCLKYQD